MIDPINQWKTWIHSIAIRRTAQLTPADTIYVTALEIYVHEGTSLGLIDEWVSVCLRLISGAVVAGSDN